ncbi:MAG: hypothetical protein HOW97_37800 [Catenulispora sp.]|nr:hypothetical protein [Catenulispora sp.]
MPIGSRLRAAAAFVAVVLTTSFSAWQHAPAAQAASPYQNGFIAFGDSVTGGWEVINPDGSGLHSVTVSGPGYDPGKMIYNIAYSPDATQVAITTEDSVLVASADGTNARLLYPSSADVAWSLDGANVILGTGHVIISLAADGSGRSSQIFADDPLCGDRVDRVSTSGVYFIGRLCPGLGDEEIAYRVGDRTPSVVKAPVPPNGFHRDSISYDGTRMLSMSNPANTSSETIAVGEIGAQDRDFTPLNATGSQGPATFGPAGDIAYLDQDWNPTGQAQGYQLRIIADSPDATSRLVKAGQKRYGLSYITWANGPSNLPARPVVDRIGDLDRVGTSVRASQWAFDTRAAGGRHAAVAVLARSDEFPDALTGTPLAIQMGGPLLLTPSDALDSAVAWELVRVLAPGSTVYLLGGTTALKPEVVKAVRSLGFNPVRLGGADRYGTAVAIATAIAGKHPRSVLLATGTNFPDALTAGVAAGQERYSARGAAIPGGGVVLLTDGTTMPAPTRAYLDTLVPSTVNMYGVGGPAETALNRAYPAWPGRTPLVGTDRFDTAVRVATSALFGGGQRGRYSLVGVATAWNFPDAMSGGALVGAAGGPLLLADRDGLPANEAAVLRAGGLSDVAVIGGPAAVSDSVLISAADTAFGTRDWTAALNRPAPPRP